MLPGDHTWHEDLVYNCEIRAFSLKLTLDVFLCCNVPIASLGTDTCRHAWSNHRRLQHSWSLGLCTPYTSGAVNNEQPVGVVEGVSKM